MLFDSLAADIRYGLRLLRQSPGFTVVAVLSLALGIGANTAIFQLVDTVRLRTLPVRNPSELVSIDFAPKSMRSGWFSTRNSRFTYGHWKAIREQQQAFSGVIAWSAARFNLANGGEARNVEGLYVSGEFFQHLGVTPLLGRVFSAADDAETCTGAGAVVSEGFWLREFGGDPDLAARKVSLDGHSFPVIGVTPAAFFGVEVGRSFDIAAPLCVDRLMAERGESRATIPHAWWIAMMGRLKPGWTIQRANAHLEAIAPAIMRATLPPIYRAEGAKRYLANKLAATDGGTGISGLRSQYERPLWLLLATTGLVLLIACANLANLLLARASTREREVAIRLAIGASRSRLVRQFLAESLLLAVFGAALGAAVAQTLSRGLVAFISTPNNPLFVGLGLEWRVLGFTAAIALTTCLLFGLLPALRATSASPTAAMRSGGRGATAGRERNGLRRALVATQVALSLVLLVGALLFTRSLRNLATVDAGFRAEGVVSVSLDLRAQSYSPERLPAVYRELLGGMAAAPGVLSGAEINFTPISGSGWNNNIGLDGARAEGSGKESFFNRAGPRYFKTMGASLVAGRDFDARDTLGSPKVAIVNREFARRFLNGANPVGHTFRRDAPAGEPEEQYEIIGLVENMKYYQLREDPIPTAFLAAAQDAEPGNRVTFVLRTAGPISDLLTNVKQSIARAGPAIGIEFRFLSQQVANSLLRDRLMATLSGAFGLLGGLLATLGLYGVISYMVARRRNEIGIRVALGADRGRVVRMVLREAAVLLAAGLGIGLLISVWAGRAAATLLFGLQPHDPVTMLLAMALLGTVALAAAYAPARRAAALEPMAALREE